MKEQVLDFPHRLLPCTKMPQNLVSFFLKDSTYLFIYQRERALERTCQRERVGEGQGEGQANSALNTEPYVGLDFMTLRS